MKILSGFLVLLGLASVDNHAQSLPPAKIHILNVAIGQVFDMKTTADQKKGITLKPKSWTVIQSAGDSLGFVVDNDAYFIHFEPNKRYYFVIQTVYGSRPIVTEKTERDFILTAGINSIKKPEEYNSAHTPN